MCCDAWSHKESDMTERLSTAEHRASPTEQTDTFMELCQSDRYKWSQVGFHEPRGAFGREGLLGPEGGPWPQPAGWGGAPYIQSADPGSAPKGREEKKLLLVLV